MMEMELTAEKQLERKIRSRKMLTSFIIFAIVMFFAGLTSAFLVSMSGGYWVHMDMPGAFHISTAAIVLSSVTAQIALSSARKGRRSLISPMLIITLLLGLIFAWFQFKGWSQMVERGQYVNSKLPDLKGKYGVDYVISRNGQFLVEEDGQLYMPDDTGRRQALNSDLEEYKNTTSAYIYALTGSHFFHLLFGLLSLVVMVVMAGLGRYTQQYHAGLWSGVMYWHFLAGLWIYLLLFLTFVH